MSKKNYGNGSASHDSPLVSNPKLYTLVINNLPIGFSLIDRDGMIVEFNPASEMLTGYSKAEVMANPILKLFMAQETIIRAHCSHMYLRSKLPLLLPKQR
jgi:PAS domain S-box-containing protein